MRRKMNKELAERLDQLEATIPRANAVATASVRECTPSFSRIALT
jgi:hypothetical protein